MQAYGQAFAKVYNKRWAFFSQSIAPKLEKLFAQGEAGGNSYRTLVDICCGTGQLAAYFLARDFRVWGVDLSPHMIEHSIENNKSFVESGEAAFSVADASSYSLPEKAGFATCMFDAMNHLPSNEAIGRCIQRTYDTLQSRGCSSLISTRGNPSRVGTTYP